MKLERELDQMNEKTIIKNEIRRKTEEVKRKSRNSHSRESKRRRESKEKVEQVCRVCAEQAAGYHYGVFTCEGCKSFFGRYQKGKRKPPQECMSGHGQCDVRSRARNRCRYCRYQKCLSAGMSKSASRYGRRSNWFKVHCLSESRDDEYKKSPGQQRIDLDPQSDQFRCRLRSNNDNPDPSTESPGCHISVISPPLVANPKPIYPPNLSPTTSGVIQLNPFHASSVSSNSANPGILLDNAGLHSAFTGTFHGKSSSSFLLPFSSAPPTSAFTPVLGYFTVSPFGRLSIGDVSLPPNVHEEPVQTEPLDLSVKRA